MTHKGLVRDSNEDMILTDPTGALWAVADGMGGHGHGEFASDLVIDHLTSLPTRGTPKERLETALQTANQALMRNQQEGTMGVAGATVVAALFDAGLVHITWAGDSRVYRLRSGVLEQMTHDHSVVQDLVDSGKIQNTDMEKHPEAHVVTRAVGGGETLTLDHRHAVVMAGDLFLLCSDGLSRCVNDAHIRDILLQNSDPDQGARALLKAAMEEGAPDNVSAIVVMAKEA